MKLFQSAIVLIALSLASNSLASAVMTIRGKLTSFTEKHYLVQRGRTVYYVKRTFVPAAQAKTLTRAGVEVSLQIPAKALERVQVVAAGTTKTSPPSPSRQR